jgi:hypothetical protein
LKGVYFGIVDWYFQSPGNDSVVVIEKSNAAAVDPEYVALRVSIVVPLTVFGGNRDFLSS